MLQGNEFDAETENADDEEAVDDDVEDGGEHDMYVMSNEFLSRLREGKFNGDYEQAKNWLNYHSDLFTQADLDLMVAERDRLYEEEHAD